MGSNRALIAMSGGVDSSVAALLVKNEKMECLGVTMKLFHNEDVCIPKAHSCCSLEDIEDARNVAYTLGIPYYVFDFSKRFNDVVIKDFVESYRQGITPNPCINCNRYLKFDQLYHRAQELDCNYVVTGHYAKIEYNEQTRRYELKKALDLSKDQSYVLYAMTQEQLAHTIFPLGNLTKETTRKIAAQNELINAKKEESQDICFVQNGDYAKFIQEYTNQEYPNGEIIDEAGVVIGTHKGIIHYTIGQRKGLQIKSNEKKFVARIIPEKNQIVATAIAGLEVTEVHANRINLISLEKITQPLRLKAKIRYQHQEQWATVTSVGQDRLKIVFDQPQKAVTKGQALVLYDGDTVVGGGTIIS